jgi:hypothetical protein
MTIYPTLADKTIVERKGEDATDRQTHVVIHPPKPAEQKSAESETNQESPTS